MISKKEIVKTIENILPEIIELRQNIHRNPELAGNEHATSTLIRNILSFTELELLPPFLETDVVGMLNGNAPGKNVTLRADMDALPLNELNDLPYKSQIPGLMHACGHDGHTAILAGTALVLNSFKDELKGSVRFVFQPGEEIAALGKYLVEAGALENPAPAAIVALHAISSYPAGSIITRSGTIMAAAGFFKIKVIGRGGHG
ncbi:MAG: amidohydrolase, partial [Victivallaceae bacterium]